MNKITLIIIISLMSTGCISTNVTKVGSINRGEEICIINNHSVKKAFATAYKTSLEERGYSTSLKNTGDHNCTITTTYTAVYGSHLGPYLASADLQVYRNNVSIGRAQYYAPYMDPLKHGSISRIIDDLVNDLFPNNPN